MVWGSNPPFRWDRRALLMHQQHEHTDADILHHQYSYRLLYKLCYMMGSSSHPHTYCSVGELQLSTLFFRCFILHIPMIRLCYNLKWGYVTDT